MTKRRAAATAIGRPVGARSPVWSGPLAIALILALHAALAVWVATRNSVTFDENFHVPAGVVALTRGDFSTSYAQPPLARSLYGAAALAAGARGPDPAVEQPGYERGLAESFMRRNADRYERVFLAGRLVAVLLSTALGFWIWEAARRRYGPTAGLVAATVWCFSPEALAHGSLAGVDVPTALTFFGTVLTAAAWLESGRLNDWLRCAAWLAAAFVVRFSAAQLPLILAALAVVLAMRGRLAAPRRAILGIVALLAVGWLAVCTGYRFQGVGVPLGRIEFHSPPFLSLARALGNLPSPLPEPYLRGLDYISYLAQPGIKESYLLGEITKLGDWRYFPVAVAVKWPLGLLALIAARLLSLARRGAPALFEDAPLLVPAFVVIASAMASNLGYGVRYLLPALPFLCVWVAGLAAPLAAPSASRARRGGLAWHAIALALALAVPLEAARALPYPLAFFNASVAGSAAGERVVNDSNVDWGQGLVALRDEMKRLGIRRVQLAYHGTTDPAVYGIDYTTFLGGAPGPESDWLAISSYFYVGLPARLMTSQGSSSRPIAYDVRPFWSRRPAAHPAGCMWLFRVR